MHTGKFITFEGVEGSGKTTQINLLADYLREKGQKIVLTREPGGTKIGDQIRKTLLLTDNRGMFPIAELFLYAAARNQHVEELIRPALKKGAIVLCDRFFDATTAYQGAARKIDGNVLEKIHLIATGGLKPDITLLLDCPVEYGLLHAKKRNQENGVEGSEDRFEQEEISFHERVRKGYLEIARAEPLRVKIIDATKTVEEMHQKIVMEVENIVRCTAYGVRR